MENTKAKTSKDKKILNAIKFILIFIVFFNIGNTVVKSMRKENNVSNVTAIRKELDAAKDKNKSVEDSIKCTEDEIKLFEKVIPEKQAKIQELQNVRNSYN